jgi:hypothetical protein
VDVPERFLLDAGEAARDFIDGTEQG